MSESKQNSSVGLSQLNNEILDELLRIFSYNYSCGDFIPRPLKVLHDEVQQLQTTDLNVSNEDVEVKMKNTVSLLRRIRPAAKITFDVQQPPREKLVNITRKCQVSSESIPQMKLYPSVSPLEDEGRAIPLCLPNDLEWDARTLTCKKKAGVMRSSLYICKPAIEILRKISGPVSVVSIVGPCRTGKSYILSRLLGTRADITRRTRFHLGHEMDPKTMGIWMWSRPYKCPLQDGTETTIILLDTEGIDAATISATTRGDNQIFTLSVLLSSLLIYNSTTTPKKGDLMKMEYIANVAQMICSKGKLSSKDARRIFPHFMWLLRDVTLEPTDKYGKPCHISDYIKQKVLVIDPMSNDVQTKISKCLIGFFASFNAEMLPPPSTNPEVLKDIENTQKHKQLEPAFVQGVQRVCQRIIELYSPKKGFVEGSNVDGAIFCKMLEQYVGTLNSPSGVPEVGTAWDHVVETIYIEVTGKALKAYDDKMVESESKMPMDLKFLLDTHNEAKSLAIKEFSAASLIDTETANYNSRLSKMLSDVSQYSSTGECDGGKLLQYIEQNYSRSLDYCRSIIQQSKKSKLDPLLKHLSVNSDIQQILKIIEDIQKEFQVCGKGPAKGKVLQEFIEEMEREQEKSEQILKQIKNYDVEAQKQASEKQQQELLYQQKLGEAQSLKDQLYQSRKDHEEKLTAIKEKLKSDEERFIKFSKEQEEQHKKHCQDMEDANMKSQKRFESELSDLRETSNKKIREIESQKSYIQTQLSKIDRDKREAMNRIEELERRVTKKNERCSVM